MNNLRRLLLALTAGLLLTTAHALPTIIQQPSNATAAAGVGALVNFTVQATGVGGVAYQWLKVGTNMTNGAFAGRATVSGVTTNSLTLNGVTTNDQSVYSCRLTDTSGSVTSSTAILTTIVPPSFTTQPITRITNSGSNVTFTSVATGTTPLGYQWLKNGTNIGGATLNTFTINNAQTNDSGNSYSVTVSNSAGVANSTNAFLYVGITPAITIQPVSLTVTQGQSATFSITATGWPLYYYWRKAGVTIPGATNSSLTFASAVASNGGFNYSCLISNFLSIGVASAPALLTVQYPPTITTNPVGKTIGVGSNFSLTVTVIGVPPPAYQWRLNGTPIAGATTTIYSLSGAQTNQAGNYDVVVTNSQGGATSSVAAITISNYPATITAQPVGGNVPVGSNFTMSASAAGTEPFTWQWRFNGNLIPGATSNSYTLGPAQLTDAGPYDAVVSNIVTGATSSVATVNVGYPPVVTQQPQSPPTNSLSGSANFTCIVTGTPPITPQWTLNGYPVAGHTNATLALTNLQATNIGFYALTATNLFGSAISSNAQLNLSGYNFSQWAGLEAWYSLNGDAADASGNGNQGTNFGAVAATDRFGNAGGAMSFNGANAYIRCRSGAYFSSNYTVAAWVNATAYNSFSRIIDFGNGGPSYNTDLALSAGTTGNSYFEAYIAGNQIAACQCTSPIPLNQWVYVVGTCDATHISIYFNAVLQKQGTVSTNRPFITTTLNYIGRSNWAPDSLYAGRFDDIRLFNRSLSSNEVAQLYALESQTTLTPQQRLSASFSGGSTVDLNLSGQPGGTYILQTATNLAAPIQWQSIGTNTANGNGACPFTDPSPAGTRRFYRAVTAP